MEHTIKAVEAIATARGVPTAQVSLAWVLAKESVAAPIVGLSKSHHLQDALKALSLTLSDEELATLEAPMNKHARPQRW